MAINVIPIIKITEIPKYADRKSVFPKKLPSFIDSLFFAKSKPKNCIYDYPSTKNRLILRKFNREFVKFSEAKIIIAIANIAKEKYVKKPRFLPKIPYICWIVEESVDITIKVSEAIKMINGQIV